MRDLMPVLAVLDMVGANIVEYSGRETDPIYPTNEVPMNAFYFNGSSENKTLKTVKLPARITSIGKYAFTKCSGLTGELKLPAGLTSIGKFAFLDCRGLTGIEFPAGLTSIGEYAFDGCRGFTGELKLPAGLTSIENSVFINCRGLTGIEFPAGLTSIGDNAFMGCNGLTGELKLPASLTSIGEYAFSYCHGLTGELNFPASLTSIGKYAFVNYLNLTGIHIKKNVKSIGESAFSNCFDVPKITCETVTPPSLGANVFKGTNIETCELFVPEGSRMNYLLAPQWGNFPNIIEIDMPSGIITPDKTIRAWKANGQLFVESTEEMSAAEVVDMSGRTACTISKTAYAYVLNLPSNGVYVVRICTVNGEVKTVKVAM